MVITIAADATLSRSVRDYGVGLRPGESSLVFNRFWRADPARARTTGGTGLGLSIALEDAHRTAAGCRPGASPAAVAVPADVPRTAGPSCCTRRSGWSRRTRSTTSARSRPRGWPPRVPWPPPRGTTNRI